MRYESEILYDLMKRDGLLNPSQDHLPYESELKEKYVNEVEGAYPKLIDYQAEWLNYAYNEPIGKFPYVTLSDVTNATIENVVPYAYKRAILKGQTLVNLCDKTKTVFSSSGNKNLWQNALFNTNPTQLTIINYTDKVIKFSVHDRTTDKWISTNGVNPNSKLLVNCGANNYLKDLYGAYGDGWSNTEEDMDILKNGILVLEGNYTNIDIPYFEGMKSVQMPVLTTSNEDGTKTNILTVNEDVTLRGIGDVKDELNCLTGELTQRIGEDGEVLSQEVVKTVDLTITNQNGESLSKMSPIEGTMNLTTSSDTIAPTFSGEIPVEAIEQNLSSFIHLEGVEENE